MQLISLVESKVITGKGVKTQEDEVARTKYPLKLVFEPLEETFDSKAFYIFEVDKKVWTYFYLVLGAIGVIAAAMIQIWPLWLKLAVWWASYIFLIFMVVVCVIRYSLFTLLFVGGYDFWLFPDLFAPDKGFIDSFFPLYTFGKSKEISTFEMLFRAVSLCGIVYFAYFLYSTGSSIEEVYEHFKEILTEVLVWGNSKVEEFHVD